MMQSRVWHSVSYTELGGACFMSNTTYPTWLLHWPMQMKSFMPMLRLQAGQVSMHITRAHRQRWQCLTSPFQRCASRQGGTRHDQAATEAALSHEKCTGIVPARCLHTTIVRGAELKLNAPKTTLEPCRRQTTPSHLLRASHTAPWQQTTSAFSQVRYYSQCQPDQGHTAPEQSLAFSAVSSASAYCLHLYVQ